MKIVLTMLLLFAAAAGAAVFATNNPDKDAFVRALAPDSNYGGAGALSVSGADATDSNPTNGVFDTFMSFDAESFATNFNAQLGTSNWVITSATLNLTENPSPGNPVFNDGTGRFQIFWIADDTWAEGTGNPKNPTTDGITYSEESNYVDSATDESLGIFMFLGTAKVSCPLALATSFVTNFQAGGEVGLFMTAVDPSIGFLFYSRNYGGNPAALPMLVVAAAAQPGIASITMSSGNLVLSATNGTTGSTYYVLTSTNLGLPANQWTPISTNILPANGNFTITITNAPSVNNHVAQFFLLETY